MNPYRDGRYVAPRGRWWRFRLWLAQWIVPSNEADWSLGVRAGPIRNQYMFDHGHPDRGLAFGSLEKPQSTKDSGTGGMVKILNRGGVLVTIVPRPGIIP